MSRQEHIPDADASEMVNVKNRPPIVEGHAPSLKDRSTRAQRLNGLSEAPNEQILATLRELIPSAWIDGELDFDALKQTLGAWESGLDRFLFTWAGKARAIQAVQSRSDQTLRPSREKSLRFDETTNIIIGGDNLTAMKILYRSYFGRIKFVYIDPPYNTGNDLIYQDDFSMSRDQYLKQTGQVDLGGNLTSSKAETGGRLHSAWLSMMYPRLMLASTLLRSDGIIAVSIHERELGNLLLLMNEVFGEENRESIVAWRRRHNQPNDPTKMIATVAEFIVFYAKNSSELKDKRAFFGLPLSVKRRAEYRNPDNDPRGDWDSKPWKAAIGQGGSRYQITSPTGKVLDEVWLGSQGTFDALTADRRIHWPRNGDGLPRKKFYLTERDETGQSAHNFWGHELFGSNQEASAELADIMGEENLFDNPKPLALIKAMIGLACGKDDIAMDFFAGTGTTGQAVVEMNAEDGGNRRFILVQLPEPKDHPTYKTLLDLCIERVRRACQDKDTGFRLLNVTHSNCEPWNAPDGQSSPDEYDLRLGLTMDGLRADWTIDGVLVEIALKEGYGAACSVEAIALTANAIHRVTSAETGRVFYACLDDALDEKTISEISSYLDKTTLFVCRDSALDDTSATNLAFVCRLKVV